MYKSMMKKMSIPKEERRKEIRISKLDSMPITTVVGNDIFFKGDIQGEGIIRVDGKVEGHISSKQGIILGEKSDVEGCLESDNIIIFGQIRGSIKSKELILKSTGIVFGEIISDFLEVEMGCKYDGNLKIGQIHHNNRETPPNNKETTID